ncbi:MAG TPA: hypothetical protein VHO25_16745 [Polyangiaceae bacterium]|nr:hypothetical protein [Polyangiaceae bacterium]
MNPNSPASTALTTLKCYKYKGPVSSMRFGKGKPIRLHDGNTYNLPEKLGLTQRLVSLKRLELVGDATSDKLGNTKVETKTESQESEDNPNTGDTGNAASGDGAQAANTAESTPAADASSAEAPSGDEAPALEGDRSRRRRGGSRE